MDGFNQKPCKSFDRGLDMLSGQSDVDMAEVDREIEVTRLIGPFWWFFIAGSEFGCFIIHIFKPNAGPGFKGCNSCSSGTTWRCWWCRPPPKQWRPGKIITSYKGKIKQDHTNKPYKEIYI